METSLEVTAACPLPRSPLYSGEGELVEMLQNKDMTESPKKQSMIMMILPSILLIYYVFRMSKVVI